MPLYSHDRGSLSKSNEYHCPPQKIKTEIIVDGYSGFLLLDKDDKPKVALHIENEMRWAMKKYKKLYPDIPLPHITPHVFRHTFAPIWQTPVWI